MRVPAGAEPLGVPASLLVVLPTYNERPNLEHVVDGILRHAWARVLVVDDASPDGTGEIADALAVRWPGRVDVLHRQGPRGLGRAYIDGLRLALATEVEAIGQMDADLSHDPAYLPDLVAALDHADLAIGSRYLHGVSVVNWPLHRIALSAFANRYIRGITGLPARDCTSGYRVWRREALAQVPLEHARASGYAFLTEMLYAAAHRGLRITERPIVFVERREGYSKVSRAVLTESLLTPLRLVWRGGRLRAPRT
jgi:dolichol-phosphate mannosyltransferase